MDEDLLEAIWQEIDRLSLIRDLELDLLVTKTNQFDLKQLILFVGIINWNLYELVFMSFFVSISMIHKIDCHKYQTTSDTDVWWVQS